jgi:CheY-like chemotaxis protein
MLSRHTKLQGKRILIVEDEAMVAIMVEDMLSDAGCLVVAVAGSLKTALKFAADETLLLDGAVLDVNLGGERVFPAADMLVARGIPFVFATGYGKAGLEGRFRNVPVLNKPYNCEALESALMLTLR